MFRGRHEHSIDAKGRLSIPRVFREALVAGEEDPPMLVNKKDHLALYPASTWAKEEELLLRASNFDPDAQRLRLFYASGSVPCPIDSQGRILVPGFLREHADLDSKVIVAGAYSHIEIYNPSRFSEKQGLTVFDFDKIQRAVSQAVAS
ncbi:MAG TPA: division/cell wall cluster transcriptional repressor MraZ [Deltaproteobacteria bacterium]|nr:division/cell wall cluster transcriptional repressor MraZ [Deltaproteobacteria bacterium]